MKFRTLKANHLYISETIFNGSVSAKIIIRVLSNHAKTPEKIFLKKNSPPRKYRNICYEVIASSIPNPNYFTFGKTNNFQEVDELLLYIHFPFKTPTFENLVKGLSKIEPTHEFSYNTVQKNMVQLFFPS